MKILNKFKTESKIIMLGVILLTVSTFTFSYSALFEIKSNTSNQVINTGSLEVTYGSSSSAINNLEMYPISDEAGLASEARSVLYIQNNSTLNSSFTMTISYDLDGFKNSLEYEEDFEVFLLPIEYIKIGIFEYDQATNQMVLISDVINLGDSPIYKLGNTYNENKYAIFNDEVEKSSSGNSTKTYAIKIWIDEDATDYISDHYIYLNVEIFSEVKEAVMNYNLNGVIKDSNGNNLNNALISLGNGSYKAVTISNGTFTINGVREGVYKLTITNDTNIHNATLKITEGLEKGLNLLNTTYIASTEDYSSVVKLHETTPVLFNKVNNITTPTSLLKLNIDETYSIPKTYVLEGSDLINLGVLTIKLDNNSSIESMSLS